MAKLEKQYPDFECVEYDYGDLSHREYDGSINASIKFADDVVLMVYIDFKEFLDYHKRKKTDFHRSVENVYADMSGWGSRYFELIELLQEEDDVDLFELFAQYAEIAEENLAKRYETVRSRMQNRPVYPTISKLVEEPEVHKEEEEEEEQQEEEDNDEIVEDDEIDDEIDDDDEDDDEDDEIETTDDKNVIQSVIEDDDDDDEITPYDRDRDRFHELLKKASNDMYDALKVDFFPQMDYFQRRYPSKWKSFKENLESILQNFEDEMLEDMLPELDDDEYREFDIKYNSQKADMSDEDEPPTAR